MSAQTSKTKAVDLLFRANVLSRAQYERAMTLLHATADRAEDVIIDNDIMSEGDLLKALAAIYRTNFVSAEKLSKAGVERATVQMIPRRVAETLHVFPVMFDRASQVLSVVTPDPDNADMLKEVKLVSGAREVKAFVGASRRDLRRDSEASRRRRPRLRALRAPVCLRLRPASSRRRSCDRREGEARAAERRPRFGGRLRPPRKTCPPRAHRRASSPDLDADAADFMGGPAPRPRQGSIPDIDPPQQPAPRRQTIQHQAREDFDQFDRSSPLPAQRRGPMPSFVEDLPPPQEPSAIHFPRQAPPPVAAPPVETAHPFHNETMVELLAVMVSLLENARQELRGHSSQVARLLKRVAERMNLDKNDIFAVIVAGHIHDIGKMGQFHLTSYNCSEYEGHRKAAEKAYDTPLRLLEAVRLPTTIKNAVFHMYERFDGKGFPDKLVGKEIPLGARLLAVADTYADLTQNPRNPFRKVLGPTEAMDVLSKHGNTIFDAAILDLFKALVLGEDMKAKLLANRHRALIIDNDPEESTVLELRMVEQGFDVKIARSADAARKLFNTEGIEFDLVVSEVELPDTDGLTFLADARKQPWGKDLAWVIHTSKQGRTEAQRASASTGAMDFIVKPVQADVLDREDQGAPRAKAKAPGKNGASKAKGVSGSLREMGLPDIVQVLFHGRKTGKLNVKSDSGKSGEIHFLEGAIANAVLGTLSGADAFYAMVRFTDGEFALDPSFVPPKRLVTESAEALLLEGMRRMDEGI